MFSSRSKHSSQNSLDSIDKRLRQNQKQMLNMQNFIELKQLQLGELQQHLIEEFKNMQQWKQKQDRIKELLGISVKEIMIDIKNLLANIIESYQNIFQVLIKEAIEQSAKKLYEKQQQIVFKNKQMKVYISQIQRLKYQVNRYSKSALNSPINITSLRDLGANMTPKSISRDPSQQKLSNTLSKSTFLDYRVQRIKNGDKIQNSRCKSPNQEKNDRILKSYKNHYQQQNRLLTKSPTTKKIVYEVRKQLKEDFQNSKLNIDHKKYVKQKIQCLKNKNSNVIYDLKGEKSLKRY